MTDRTSPTFRLGPLLAAGLLVLVGLISLALQYRFANTGADQADWDRAAELAVELAQPTDGIRVHPTWSEAPLPAMKPLGNLLNRQHQPLVEDLIGIERLLILSEANRTSQALQMLPFDAAPDHVHDLDSVQLLEVTIPLELRLHHDLIGQLSGADVAYVGDDEVQPCRWHRASGAWRCRGSRRGAMVQPILLEIEHDPRRCVQAFPPSGERHLSIEMTIEEASDILRIRAGLDQRAARLERGQDVIYRLYVNESKVADQRVDGHTSIWQAHDIPTSEFDGQPVDLRIEVESIADEPHHRRFCFNAWPMTTTQASN